MANIEQTSKPSARSVAEAGNKFMFNLYKTLTTENQDSNIFFSPYSISAAMSMVLLGSRCSSEAELSAGLGFGKTNSEVIFKGIREIHEELNKLGQGVALDTANRLYPEETYKILEKFLKDCKEFFGCEVTSLDFKHDPQGSRKIINDWVLKQTKDKIKDLIPDGVINPATSLVLANAIYFKGSWDKMFDPQSTQKRDFHVAANNILKVDMMSKKAKYRFTEDENSKAKVLEIPYKGLTTTMIIVLPDERFGLSEVEKNINYEKLKSLEDSLFEEEVVLSLPKFKMEFSSDLVKPFQSLGVTSIFGGNADFSGMSDSNDLFVSSIAHKAFIEVNEEGTEAAAATAVMMMRMSMMMPLPPKQFTCDHPFLFFIKHKPTDVILFAGRFSKP